MKEAVRVRMKSRQTLAERTRSEEPIEVTVSGTCSEEKGDLVILFEEGSKEQGSDVSNRLVIGENSVEVHKTGQIRSHMRFEKGKSHPTDYITPFGVMRMAVKTEELLMRRWENRLILHIAYALYVEEEHAADCVMDIRVEDE